MTKKTHDSSLFILVNMIIWGISGNIQMQPFSMKENGVLLGVALGLFGGLTCYFSSKILLLKSIEHNTVEYIDIIRHCLGKLTS
jgi:hypothetical protein